MENRKSKGSDQVDPQNYPFSLPSIYSDQYQSYRSTVNCAISTSDFAAPSYGRSHNDSCRETKSMFLNQSQNTTQVQTKHLYI